MSPTELTGHALHFMPVSSLHCFCAVQLPVNEHRPDNHQKTLSGTEGDYCYSATTLPHVGTSDDIAMVERTEM